jgi:hypothetical protein
MMESTSSSNKNRVSFARQAAVRRTISLEGFTLEELEAAWFTRDEFADIKKSCCRQIIKMGNGERLLDKKYCSRGLEGHTRLGNMSKSLNRTESIRAVLEEQDWQFDEGRPYDPEAISSAYHRITSSCQLWASSIGLEDQRAAECYEDDETIIVGNKKRIAVSSPEKGSNSKSTSRKFSKLLPSRTPCRRRVPLAGNLRDQHD